MNTFTKTDEAKTVCNLVFIKHIDEDNNIEWRCEIENIMLILAPPIEDKCNYCWSCFAVSRGEDMSSSFIASGFEPNSNLAVKLCLYSLTNIKENIEQILWLSED